MFRLAFIVGALCASTLVLSSCVLMPFGPEVTGEPGGYPSPMGDGLFEYRVVVHCHSHHSHDSEGSYHRIAAAARRMGINAVLLTDHFDPREDANQIRGDHGGVILIPGLELRYPPKASLLVVAPKSKVRDEQTLEQRVEQFAKDDTFLVAGHVEGLAEDFDPDPVAAFEVYNLHAEFSAASRWMLLLRGLFLFPDAFFEHTITSPTEQLRRYDRALEHKRLVAVAGHDAHANIRVFGRLGGAIGDYGQIFRLFSTRVLAPELSESAITHALRAGRTYVAFDYLGDPKGFSIRYGLPDAWATIGDAVSYGPTARLRVHIPQRSNFRVLRDGKEIVKEHSTDLDVTLPGPGVYRLEASLHRRLWIITSPIYVQ